ncbi:MAG: putative baseplate assembly protein [Actinomycetota bacterium]|nr:putative baseplate assembly protein [Actinomycetota bacterium]
MTLEAPNLDDRRFQDLVDEAKRRVQRSCPEWSDHNVSDPGVTLIETFAYMVDQLFYRLNRVPDRVYVKLLDLIGVKRFPPSAAKANVTFWLSAAETDSIHIPAGTVVSTLRSEKEDPVPFTVVRPLTVPSCSLAAVAKQAGGSNTIVDLTPRFDLGEPVYCFSGTPAPGDAFLVGLDRPVPFCTVLLRVECTTEGAGVDPDDPPLVWEARTEQGWVECDIESDGTGGFNRRHGDVKLHVPGGHSPASFAGTGRGWLRCRLVEPKPGQDMYRRSPRIDSIEAQTVAGTTTVQHAEVFEEEMLGVSDGTPGQRFGLAHIPVVPTAEPPVVQIAEGARWENGTEVETGWEDWTEVKTFASSGPADRHFALDRATGEVSFGPAIRQPNGVMRGFGAVPAPGARVRIRSYRAGGGSAGNVPAGAIAVLKGAIPFVTRVENREPATGGVDGEDLEAAKERGPIELHTRDRAVTASDYESLTREIAPEIARVRCQPISDRGPANVVRVLVVPALTAGTEAAVDLEALRPPAEVLSRIRQYLDARRPVGTQLIVQPPWYQAITVVSRLRARAGHRPDVVSAAAIDALSRFFHPLVGGPDGTGWPFGRPAHVGDVHAVLQAVRGIDLVGETKLFAVNPKTGAHGPGVPRVDVAERTLILSFKHQVLVEVA